MSLHSGTSIFLTVFIYFHRRAGRGGEGGAAPPNFGQLRFFEQQEKIWAEPFLKDISVLFFISLKRQIFSILI